MNLVLLLTSTACEKVLDVDLNETDPKIVIEAVVTNTDYAWVKLSWTTNYYDTALPEKINNAIVVVSDNEGNMDTLDLLDKGFYKSSRIKGVEGRIYFLTVQVDGKEYKSQSLLPGLAPIDSLSYQYYPGGDLLHEEGYYPTIYFKDPKNSEDYYMLVYYKNNKLLNKPTDLQVTDDKNLQELIAGYEVFYPLQLKDTFKLQLNSITKEAFIFIETCLRS